MRDVVPNGPAAARTGSTWIHWWSPVASANRSIRSCVDADPVADADLLADQRAAGRPAGRNSRIRWLPQSVHAQFDDRLPLLEVALEAASTRRPTASARARRGARSSACRAGSRAPARRRLSRKRAQLVGRDRALARAHADARAVCTLVAAPVREQLVDEVVRRVDVEDARLQRDQHLVGELHHLVEALAVQAGRRVEHDVGRALGRPHDLVARRPPRSRSCGRPAGRRPSQVRDDCWRSTSPSMTCAPRDAR